MHYIAHRGLSQRYAENSLEAFVEAKKVGATWYECDVHVCATGELVVIHDDTLQRTHGAPLRVSEMSREALASYGICTLSELCAALTEGHLVVEIKARNSAERVLACLLAMTRIMPQLTYTVSSFKKTEVEHVCAMLREQSDVYGGIRAAVTVWGTPSVAEMDVYASWGVHELHCNESDDDCDAALVTRAHAHAMQVYVYTVNDTARLKEVILWGVDGVFTDRYDTMSSYILEGAVY